MSKRADELLYERIEKTPPENLVSWLDDEKGLYSLPESRCCLYGNVTEDGFNFDEVPLQDVLKAFWGEFLAYRDAIIEKKEGTTLQLPKFKGCRIGDEVVAVGWTAKEVKVRS